MKKKFKLGIIGAGFMSSAIIKGIIKAKILSGSDICVSDVSTQSLQLISSYGVSTTLDNAELVNNCSFVLFAIKPQNLKDVLASINGCDCCNFISIMAGVKKEKIKSNFPNSRVARAMPNTPCSIGFGTVGIDLADYTDENDRAFIINLFSSFAKVIQITEDKLNAVTGVSGSSPAYFYLFVKGIIDAGVEHGLTYEQAKELAVNTMIGAGNMILQNEDKSIDQLINAVCSKGGTTIQAIDVYNNNNLTEITKKAIESCVKRSIELENI